MRTLKVIVGLCLMMAVTGCVVYERPGHYYGHPHYYRY